MEKEKVFRTKTGFCHIFPDRIVLTRDGIVGNLSEITVSNSISRILTIYTLLLVGPCILHLTHIPAVKPFGP